MTAPDTAAQPMPGNRIARWCYGITGGAPIYPLAVLFGLNAVDELGRFAFGVLLPNIRDDFGLSTQGVLTVVAFGFVGALVLALPIGFWGDRFNRILLIVIAGILLGTFTILTALAVSVVMLAIARAGSELGRGFNDPVQNSLIPDYYDVPVRPKVYAVHRSANALGQALGPLLGGVIAYFFGWRAPFFFFAIPTAIFVILALRLRDPVRGHFERQRMGASEAAVATEEAPPSWAESWRIVWQVRTLRRIFAALPFVALSIVGLLTVGSLFYQEIFGLNEVQRGVIAAVAEPAQIAGFFIGIPDRDPVDGARSRSGAQVPRRRHRLHRRRVGRVLAGAQPACRHRLQHLDLGLARLARAGHLQRALAGRAPEGALLRLCRRRHVDHPRPARCSPSSAGSPTPTAFGRRCWRRRRCSSSAG